MDQHDNNNWPKFIIRIENGNATLKQKTPYSKIVSKENFYRFLEIEGLYLPSLPSPALTHDYLKGLLNGINLRFPQS
jgi:hypothetical protein